jgi:hypothetical protein
LWVEEKKRASGSAKRAESKECFVVLWFKEELGNKIVIGTRIHGYDFHYKMINEANE